MTGIEFTHVSKFYGEVLGLNDVSFRIPKGITGLVGSNGAGKSTTLKLCVALLYPNLGGVTIDGQEIWGNLDYLSKIGYATEKDKLYLWMTGREFLEWNGKMFGLAGNDLNKKVNEVLKLMGMISAADRKIAGYSRGMRQRIKIGQTLLNDPEIIFVDEPMSGTDPLGRYAIAEVFKSLFRERGTSVILSSHVLHELERISTSMLILENGKLVAEGSLLEIRKALSKIPQRLILRTNDNRKAEQLLVNEVNEIKKISSSHLEISVSNRLEFEELLMDIQKDHNLQVLELYPVDSDLNAIYRLLKTGNDAKWRYLA